MIFCAVDKTRVKLPVEDGLDSDYINATFIEVCLLNFLCKVFACQRQSHIHTLV